MILSFHTHYYRTTSNIDYIFLLKRREREPFLYSNACRYLDDLSSAVPATASSSRKQRCSSEDVIAVPMLRSPSSSDKDIKRYETAKDLAKFLVKMVDRR